MSKELNDKRITVYKEAIKSRIEKLEVMTDKIYMQNKLIEKSKTCLLNYIVEKEILENEIDYHKKYLKSLGVNL